MKSVTANELKEWLTEGNVMLLDVRELFEWQQGYIESAQHIPLGLLTVDKINLNGKTKLVIYCRSGVRSASACAMLEIHIPYADVFNLTGGFLAWANS